MYLELLMKNTKEENNDILILNQEDLLSFSIEEKEKKCCHALTMKNKSCKKIEYEGSGYCKMHHKKFRLEKPEECPVCMDNLKNVIQPLSCGHWVHRKCIVEWGKAICPVCRTDIKVTPTEMNKIKKKAHQHRREIEEAEEFPYEIYIDSEELIQLDEMFGQNMDNFVIYLQEAMLYHFYTVANIDEEEI